MSTRIKRCLGLLLVLGFAIGVAGPAVGQNDEPTVPQDLLNQPIPDLMEKGNQHFDNQEYRKARPYYLAVVTKDSTQAGVYARLSDVAFQLFDLTTAQKYLRKAIEIEPANEEFRSSFQMISELVQTFQDGVDALKSQNYETAEAKFDEVQKRFADFPPAFYHKGLLYKLQNKTDLAVDNFKKAIDADPDNTKYIEALDNLAKSHFQEGIDNYKRGNYTVAGQKFTSAVSIDSTLKQAHYMLGIIARRRGNISQAIKHYKDVLSIDDQYEAAWFALGLAYKTSARDQEALDAFTKATEINSNYDKAFKERGMIQLKRERYRDAEQSFLQATQANPQNAAAYEGLGLVYQKTGELQKSAEKYATSLALDETNHTVHYRLSEVYHDMGDYPKTKESAQKALELKPNYAPALVQLGDAECHLGNMQAARRVLEKAKRDAQWRAIAEHKLEIMSKTGECEVK